MATYEYHEYTTGYSPTWYLSQSGGSQSSIRFGLDVQYARNTAWSISDNTKTVHIKVIATPVISQGDAPLPEYVRLDIEVTGASSTSAFVDIPKTDYETQGYTKVLEFDVPMGTSGRSITLIVDPLNPADEQYGYDFTGDSIHFVQFDANSSDNRWVSAYKNGSSVYAPDTKVSTSSVDKYLLKNDSGNTISEEVSGTRYRKVYWEDTDTGGISANQGALILSGVDSDYHFKLVTEAWGDPQGSITTIKTVPYDDSYSHGIVQFNDPNGVLDSAVPDICIQCTDTIDVDYWDFTYLDVKPDHEYTLSQFQFENRGGLYIASAYNTVPKTIKTEYDSITLPSPDLKEGYEFIYWCFDENLNDPVSGGELSSDDIGKHMSSDVVVSLYLKSSEKGTWYILYYNEDEDTPFHSQGPFYEGDTAIVDFPQPNPSKDSTAAYTYGFDGWFTADGEEVENGAELTSDSNVYYYAQYTGTLRSYTITFDPKNGDEVIEESAKYGTLVSTIKPSDPYKDGYIFTGWLPEIESSTTVAGNQTYIAQYTEDEPEHTEYTITWKDYDGTVLAIRACVEGQTPVYPNSYPTRDGYTFTGWSPAPYAANKNQTYTAQYTDNEQTFEVWVRHSNTWAKGILYGKGAAWGQALEIYERVNNTWVKK